MKYTKELLLEDPTFRHFYEICQVPHGSKKEKALSDFLLRWALIHGLEATQDSVNNILIRKPATVGYEQAPVIMLQAHMDMVCEKAPEVDHDFDTDPIHWQIDGDLLSTGGRTTLGADNGIGIAYAMAILSEQGLTHPSLEVLFTVAEEEDFTGAIGFDANKSKATRLINLDHACEHEILCGSCGGMAVDLTVPTEPLPVPNNWVSYSLNVSGLYGGHSGEDIARGHGNAIALLARVLLAFEETSQELLLGGIHGGSMRLAIPRDARAHIYFPKDNVLEMEQIVKKVEHVMQSELSVTGKNLRITLSPCEPSTWCTTPETALTVALLSPDGIYQMNESFPGLVDVSDNMGEFYLKEDELHVVFEIRFSQKSIGEYLFRRINRLAKLLGGKCKQSKEYPSWSFCPESDLRKIAGVVFEEFLCAQPDYFTVHAGLEVGILSEKIPGLDAISIGPDCWNFHSPSEKVSIPSAQKVYQMLCSILAKCK